MRKIIILFCVMLGLAVNAQKKSAKHIIKVDGICGMCKKRIEKTCIRTKGVKFAKWDMKTHLLTVILNEHKTSLNTISEKLANAGHDNQFLKAPQEAYDNLHECCKYRLDNPKDTN